MSQLEVFNFQGFEIRSLKLNGQIWFVLVDVCNVLELGNPSQVKARLDEGVISNEVLQTKGGMQRSTIINEDGLYDVILESRKPEARAFRKWITSSVLPSIRKTGMYAADELLDNPDLFISTLTKLKEERESRRRLEEQSARDRPKVLYAESVEVSETTILVGELAKLLKQNDINIGQNRLFRMLRDEGYLGKRGEYYNMPTQRSMELGLFEIKTRTVSNPDGSNRITRTTKVTGKGQIYFVNKFKGDPNDNRMLKIQ